jgi:hypothetical protein
MDKYAELVHPVWFCPMLMMMLFEKIWKMTTNPFLTIQTIIGILFFAFLGDGSNTFFIDGS